MAEHTGNTGLFAVFLLSLYFLLLGSWTLWRCCSDEEPENPEDWQEGKKRKSGFSKKLKKYFTTGNIITIVLWVFFFVLVVYVQQGLQDSKPFDPYEILQIPTSATEKEIQKAYRKLAMKYHPDKNPDPEAAKYFAEKVKPAHEALSNPVARENWEKYGHPDGQQSADLNVALPSFLFNRDKKAGPVLLLVLVGGGILLPLAVVSYYVLSSKQYAGPNRIMNETIFNLMYSPYNVKESQGLVRIPETLLCAAEFLYLPTPATHEPALEEMRKLVLMYHNELNPKEKPKFWKRKASVIKVNLLLLLHLQREGDNVPDILKQDLKFFLTKSQSLLLEVFNIATMQRPPYGYGWMCPAIASVEMMQHLVQAVPIEERKPSGKGESAAALLQLPHFSKDLIKKLGRDKTTPVKSLQDLQDLSSEDVEALLSRHGLSAEEVEDVATHLSVLPTVHVWAECFVEGEEDILHMDPVRCNVRMVLTRPSHKSPAFKPKSKAVLALAPHFPAKHEEAWFVMVTDPVGNALMASSKVPLVEAETLGYTRAEQLQEILAEEARVNAIKRAPSGSSMQHSAALVSKWLEDVPSGKVGDAKADKKDKAFGQVEELMFFAPLAGRYELNVVVMSDCYIGCDRTIKVPFRVQTVRRTPPPEAAKPPKPPKGKEKGKDKDKEEKDRSEEEEEEKNSGGSNDNSDSDASGSDGDDNSEEYDSEETGTDVSDTDDDLDDAASESTVPEASSLASSATNTQPAPAEPKKLR